MLSPRATIQPEPYPTRRQTQAKFSAGGMGGGFRGRWLLVREWRV